MSRDRFDRIDLYAGGCLIYVIFREKLGEVLMKGGDVESMGEQQTSATTFSSFLPFADGEQQPA